MVVILPTGTDNATRVSTNTHIIAIDNPNNNRLVTIWLQYRVSVDAIEAATGLDMLSAVPAAI